ncbi:MAG: T9SS type A sorting domain-containing protein, partial [Ginsengibacter sp.]
SPYKQENRTVVQKYKYNNWFISGGYNKWAMDQDASFSDSYFGKNGHEWSQYQRRNNMTGGYRFTGHRGDILNTEYLLGLQTNLCYVACNNGERKANSQSVPDINNTNAMEYWASTIQQRFTYYKNVIAGNPSLYKNIYRNFNYGNEYIGIEVPDGSAWGNSSDNLGCTKGNFKGEPYPKVSDQQFLLANFTASKINTSLTSSHFQCYAYSGHADVPSTNISINKNIDVQVVASAFQSETSPIGLLNRWYSRHQNISEYDYMNIPQWTGETPIFSYNNYKNTLARIKQKNGQGLVMEASPAKFASLPFLFAGNRYLQYDIAMEKSLDEFAGSMFPANIAVHIKQLLNYWGDNVMNGGDFTTDNKYKIPLFLQEMSKAIAASKNAGAEVVARLQEFKAYLHYIILYYDCINDNRTYLNKADKAADLCLYLAKINKLQLVNSYFLILDIVNKFPVAGDFYKKYNVTDGTAYLNGSLPSITDEEINNIFSEDVSKYAASVTDFKFEKALDIISKMKASGLKPLDKIKVGIGYTNGYDYPGKYQFYFYAPAAGSININSIPAFNMPEKGFINFTVEAVDKPLLVIKDETISSENNSGNINIIIPSAGLYVITTASKFKSYANLIITTNGNTFFKGGPFYGKRAENYRLDTLKSLPKYFYVPNISQLYFSINNACYTNTCLSPDAVQRAFGIKDNYGQPPVIEVSPFDSSLYKIAVPSASAGTFWQVTNLREYNFCLANISNIEVFAEKKPEAGPLPQVLDGATVIFPNPSNGVYNFKKNSAPLVMNTINVFDPQGKKIVDAANTSSINLSNLSAGVYFFSAQKDNEIIKGKLIKN